MANWRSYIDPSIGDGQNTIDGIIANGSTYGLQISDDLSVTGLSTFSDIARFSSTVRLDGQLRDGDNAFGSSGQVLSSDGTDTRWINAGELSAGAASQVAVNDDSNTNAERFITIVDAASGNNNVKTDASLKYNPSTNTITTVNITGNVAGNLTGNASSATVLQNTRTIGGVSFNGSANINLPGVNQTGNQNTSGSSASCTGNSATATTLQTTRTIGGVNFNGSSNINLPGVNETGNQNTSGNAATATVLETARNFSISGEITANAQSFNGSGDLTLSATVDDNIIDEANLKISNSPSNGKFLQCNTGVSGGLTWADVTIPSSSTLSGTTLASGITASSITSLGTLTGLTVDGTVSVTGNLRVDINSNVDGILGQAYTNFFGLKHADQTFDSEYMILSQDNHTYISATSGYNVVLRNGGNDSTNQLIIGSGNDALTWRGNKVFHAGNDGSGSTLDADKLDGQEGSYYQNAGNLNAGTIPDARLANSSLFVTGMIIIWNGAQNAIPSGWVICDGNNNTPDLRNRFIVGAGSGGSYSPGDTGGANSVTLTEAQMPSHNHSFSGSSSHSHTINNHTHSFSGSGSQSHSHSFKGVGGNDHNDSQRNAVVMRNDNTSTHNNYTASSNTGVQSASVSISISGNTGNPSDRGTNSQTVTISGNTGSKGSGNSHENRPPYYALCYIMKT